MEQPTSLDLLEQRFKARYDSYRLLRGKEDTARVWKRAWLDVKREQRKVEKVDGAVTFTFEYPELSPDPQYDINMPHDTAGRPL